MYARLISLLILLFEVKINEGELLGCSIADMRGESHKALAQLRGIVNLVTFYSQWYYIIKLCK